MVLIDLGEERYICSRKSKSPIKAYSVSFGQCESFPLLVEVRLWPLSAMLFILFAPKGLNYHEHQQLSLHWLKGGL
jgi:hypothetical protein